MNKLKTSLAALGLSAALAAGPAAAAINWTSPTTLFEDDDIDFILDSDLNPKAGDLIVEGDVFVSVFELNDAGGAPILPEELSGVIGIQVLTISAPDLLGFVDMTFAPYSGGLDAILALGSTDQTVTGGGAGGGAMVATWLTPDPDLDISADNIVAGTVSCATLEECIDQSVGIDDNVFEIDGFTGVDGAALGDEFWLALNVQVDTSIVLATQPALELGSVNAGVTVLENNTGQPLEPNSISCFPFCGFGVPDDGFVDVLGAGSIKGGLGLSAGLIADGGFGSSDFDVQKAPAVPEPSTLALLAAGFLGLGAAQRRRRKA